MQMLIAIRPEIPVSIICDHLNHVTRIKWWKIMPALYPLNRSGRNIKSLMTSLLSWPKPNGIKSIRRWTIEQAEISPPTRGIQAKPALPGIKENLADHAGTIINRSHVKAFISKLILRFHRMLVNNDPHPRDRMVSKWVYLDRMAGGWRV